MVPMTSELVKTLLFPRDEDEDPDKDDVEPKDPAEGELGDETAEEAFEDGLEENEE